METGRASVRTPFFFGKLLSGPTTARGGGEPYRDLTTFPHHQRKRPCGQRLIAMRRSDLILVRKASLAASFRVEEADAHRGQYSAGEFFLHSELAKIGERVLDFTESAEHGLRPLRSGAVNTRAGNLKVSFAPTRVDERHV